MWVSQTAYRDGLAERLKLQADCDSLRQMVSSQKSTLEWLMLRMTQLEAERAKLLWTYLGVKVPVMEIAEEPAHPTFDNPSNALPNFGDMGDTEALKNGYGHDEEGNLTLHGQRI